MIQRIWAAILFVLGLAIFATAVIIAYAPEANAEVSVRCWTHLAEHPGTTAAADRRYHLERAEASDCSEKEAAEADHLQGTKGRSDDTSAHDDYKRDKPGYGCKWTLSGRKCG